MGLRDTQSASGQGALAEIADGLREEGTVISDHVTNPTEPPVLGPFAALGPRCQQAPREYSLVIESIREGYLLHYGRPRVLADLDPDLALLAGDHLYALGLDRLATLGDLEAVRELADLISLCAQLADGGAESGDAATALWLASVTAVAAGGSPEHEAAKAALRGNEDAAPSLLSAAARTSAAAAGLTAALGEVAEAIESRVDASA
jgi:hypothetical protein